LRETGRRETILRMFSPRLVLCCFLFSCSAFAADRPATPQRLWEGKAPDALGDAEKDTPTLTPFWPITYMWIGG